MAPTAENNKLAIIYNLFIHQRASHSTYIITERSQLALVNGTMAAAVERLGRLLSMRGGGELSPLEGGLLCEGKKDWPQK